jgi:hypothetical protein
MGFHRKTPVSSLAPSALPCQKRSPEKVEVCVLFAKNLLRPSDEFGTIGIAPAFPSNECRTIYVKLPPAISLIFKGIRLVPRLFFCLRTHTLGIIPVVASGSGMDGDNIREC